MTKNIIITGGQLYNKGAEAMVYLAVDQLKKKYPDANMIVLSSADYKRTEEEKAKFNFEILPRVPQIYFPLPKVLKNAPGLKNQARSLVRFNVKEAIKFRKILKNTLLMVDISGYALSSQFKTGHSLNYLSAIFIAKQHNVPFYLMPQSFGPFDYSDNVKKEMDKLIGEALNYPEVIFAREKEGYDLLNNQYSLKDNLKLSMDSVLVNSEINLKNVFREVPKTIKTDHIKGVGIVPNMKTFEHGDKENLLVAYKVMIDYLINKGKQVYIVRHSFEDLEACVSIKEMYEKNNSVTLVEDDMSCLDFDVLVNSFDFIIGSRYHSIVHAYKNGVPTIAIGWATKYHELLASFNQSQYIFDVRNKINKNDLIATLEALNTNYSKESSIIKKKLVEVQANNPYDVIK